MNGTISPKNKFLIDTPLLRNGALVFRAINHPVRQGLLRLLHTKGEVTVTQLYTKMRLQQSAASQHLSILRQAALVKTRREGKQIIYSVNYNRVQHVHDTAVSLLDVITPM
jgi:DNA-binding transcriptional ArsR family regulator